MHTQPHPKIRRSGRRLAIAGVGRPGVAGLAVFAVGGATGALAQVPASTDTVATATVASASSLTDNTANITFGSPNAIAGDTYTADVSLTAVDNQLASSLLAEVALPPGTGQAETAGLWNGVANPGAAYIPYSSLTDNGVTGTDTTNCTLVTTNAGCETYTPLDSQTTTGTFNDSDVWQLAIPAGQAPGTYTSNIYYELNG